jgi:hypothetical protein
MATRRMKGCSAALATRFRAGAARGSAVLLLPLLAGCISDAASYIITPPDHALTLIREQRWFWRDEVELHVVAARLPECQRRHKLVPARAAEATVEVYQLGSTTFVLKQGAWLYLTETRSCTGFERLDTPPPGGLGAPLGVFREDRGRLRFVAASG